MDTGIRLKKKPALRLIVNANKMSADSSTSHAVVRNDSSEQVDTQLEMFGQPNSVYFAAVRELDLNDVKRLIDKHHFHHIVDLREVPYLNFGKFTRDAFFSFISDRAVEYVSLFSFATEKSASSMSELFEENGSGQLIQEISRCIEDGPTLILTSRGPEDDAIAVGFSKFLSKSNISYSEIAS